MNDGAMRTREALTRWGASAGLGVADRFAPWLDGYAELIAGPGGTPAGFMTRGEDATFTAAVQATLAELDMPAAARAHHERLAEWFEHKRAFFKVEWHPEGPLAACYFRRRPSVDDVLLRLARFGVAPVIRAAVADVAARLGKGTVHFVSAAFRPASEVHHKLYFSQWVTPDTYDAVLARVQSVFERFGLGPAMQHWRVRHRWSVPTGESTFFVSMSFTADRLSPTFKIDYPEVGAVRASTWRPLEEQDACVEEIEALCPVAGVRTLTYLGARFHPGQVEPTLKYYLDVPRPHE